MARGVLNSSDSTPEIAPPGGFPGPLSFRTWLDALTSGGGPAWLSVEGGARVDVSKELMDFRGLWRQVFNRQNMSSQSEAASTPTHTEWMGVVSWQPGEELLQAEDMIHWLTPTRVELGTLVMTDRRVLFVVTGKAGATIRFSLLANQVSKSNEHCEGDGQLVFSAGEECRVFTPEAGRRSVRSFWSLLELRGAERPDNTLYTNQSINGILGEAPFMRIKVRDEEVAHMERAQVFYADRAGNQLAFLYPTVPDKVLSVGNVVQVEVGRWDGVYLFDAEISGVMRAPESFAKKVGKGRFVISFMRPRNISRYNRRNAFRVVFDEPRPTQFLILDDYAEAGVPLERHEADIIDMSTTGCAIRTRAQLRVGDVLRLDVVLFDGSTKSMEAEIRNVVPPQEEEETARFGCLFHGLTKKDKHQMLKEIMTSQRELLRLIIDRQVEL